MYESTSAMYGSIKNVNRMIKMMKRTIASWKKALNNVWNFLSLSTCFVGLSLRSQIVLQITFSFRQNYLSNFIVKLIFVDCYFDIKLEIIIYIPPPPIIQQLIKLNITFFFENQTSKRNCCVTTSTINRNSTQHSHYI